MVATRLSFAVLSFALLPAAAAAAPASPDAYWPQWRGPQVNGVAPYGDPPTAWSETENVRFKVEIPGRGLSTPIVWGEQIFLLTAEPEDRAAYAVNQQAAAEKLERQEWPPAVEPLQQSFVVLSLSRRDGSTLWRRVAAARIPHESHHLDASWASASPVTDGEALFASFGSNGLYAFALDGTPLWNVDLGDMRTRNGFGEGASPAIHGDLLVVNWDHEGDSFLVALDKRNGEERWRVERPGEVTSWSTPLIATSAGRPQVVVAATGFSRGYDLATGAELWRLAGMTTNSIPSPIERDGVVFLMSGYRGMIAQAVALAEAKGDLAGTPAVVWTHDRDTPYVPSPLLYDGRLYFLKHLKGILSCLDADDGSVLFKEQRLEGTPNVWASPVGAAGRVYVLGREGATVVLRHSASLEVLATNQLDDRFDASPAIVGRELLLRGRRYLYSLEETASVAAPQTPISTEEAPAELGAPAAAETP